MIMQMNPHSTETRSPRAKIAVRDLWMTFKSPDKTKPDVPVLEDLNLEILDGEFVCFVGPSGCGKSTLLNIAGGFLQASRGGILIEGKRVTEPDPRHIFIFQENGVFPWLNVEDNVGFGVKRSKPQERQKLIDHYIEMVGLTGFSKTYPRELS